MFSEAEGATYGATKRRTFFILLSAAEGATYGATTCGVTPDMTGLQAFDTTTRKAAGALSTAVVFFLDQLFLRAACFLPA